MTEYLKPSFSVRAIASAKYRDSHDSIFAKCVLCGLRIGISEKVERSDGIAHLACEESRNKRKHG